MAHKLFRKLLSAACITIFTDFRAGRGDAPVILLVNTVYSEATGVYLRTDRKRGFYEYLRD